MESREPTDTTYAATHGNKAAASIHSDIAGAYAILDGASQKSGFHSRKKLQPLG